MDSFGQPDLPEKEPGILACSIAGGYQYADVPAMGPCVVVITDGDEARAQREAERLEAMMWDVREQLIAEVPGPAAAVQPAAASQAAQHAVGASAAEAGGAAGSLVVLTCVMRL